MRISATEYITVTPYEHHVLDDDSKVKESNYYWRAILKLEHEKRLRRVVGTGNTPERAFEDLCASIDVKRTLMEKRNEKQ